jgi:hypothetical protein
MYMWRIKRQWFGIMIGRLPFGRRKLLSPREKEVFHKLASAFSLSIIGLSIVPSLFPE